MGQEIQYGSNLDLEQALFQKTTLYQEHRKHKGLFKTVIFL